MGIFKTVSPVCPVIDMREHADFWSSLGFRVQATSGATASESDYAVIGMEGMELHLQTFTADQLSATQTMATRIELSSLEELNALHEKWRKTISISAPLEEKPWGTIEFGFYDPVGTPFFFYVDQ